MANNQERFAYLFQQYMQGKATLEEQQQFWDAMAGVRRDEEAFLESAMLEYWENESPDSELNSEQLLQRVLAQKKIRFSRPGRSYWPAAAAVLLICVGITYWWWNKPATPTAPTLAVHDLPAGRKQATLTLDDGSTLTLDSTRHGLLAHQGNITVNNLPAGLQYEGKSSGSAGYNILTTYKGQQYPVILEDGTRVLLDASSSLRFPVSFEGSEREVQVQGRAWFIVAPHPNKPFYVTKGDKKVIVLGTRFNVDAYNDESTTRITLIAGSVKVMNGPTTQLLYPGQQAILDNNSADISVNKHPDIEETIAWTDGSMVFKNADIATILKEIERWYDVKVVIQGKLQEHRYYFSVSRSATLAEALRFLQIYHINYKINEEEKSLIIQPQ